jgi:hypothetical protein
MNNQAFELLKAFIRVIGITFLLNVVMELSHLLEEFVYLSQGGFIARTAVAVTMTLAFRCVVNITLAAVFWYFAPAVARFVGGCPAHEASDSSTFTGGA